MTNFEYIRSDLTRLVDFATKATAKCLRAETRDIKSCQKCPFYGVLTEYGSCKRANIVKWLLDEREE